jgi:anti-sigma-K factor RskA
MATEVEMRAMNEQQAMAEIPKMTLSELREAQGWALNSGILRAVQEEVHWREAVDARRASGRLDAWRFLIVAAIALATLVVAVAAFAATR